mmetsp:Transcript_20266/g.48021  ORF Transcript_20266/g.48021 Transcript_20266/m.48021 type:complete len:242 (-) Transcript_20266:50-775(-)
MADLPITWCMHAATAHSRTNRMKVTQPRVLMVLTELETKASSWADAFKYRSVRRSRRRRRSRKAGNDLARLPGNANCSMKTKTISTMSSTVSGSVKTPEPKVRNLRPNSAIYTKRKDRLAAMKNRGITAPRSTSTPMRMALIITTPPIISANGFDSTRGTFVGANWVRLCAAFLIISSSSKRSGTDPPLSTCSTVGACCFSRESIPGCAGDVSSIPSITLSAKVSAVLDLLSAALLASPGP